MEKDENLILTIDISSNSIKVGLVSEQLKIKIYNTQELKIYNEDLDGFAKRFDMEDLWNRLSWEWILFFPNLITKGL